MGHKKDFHKLWKAKEIRRFMLFKFKKRQTKSDRKKKRLRLSESVCLGELIQTWTCIIASICWAVSSILTMYSTTASDNIFTETKVWSGDHRELHIDDLCCGLATVPMITCRLCPLIRYRLVERCSAPAACLVSLHRTQTFHWSNNGWRHWRRFGHQQMLRNRDRFRVGGCFRILRERDRPESKIYIQTKTK